MSSATRTYKYKATWDWSDVAQPDDGTVPKGVSARGKRAIRNVTREKPKPVAAIAHANEILVALNTRLNDLAALKDRVEREMAEVQHQIDSGRWGAGPTWLHQITPGHMMTPDLAADIRKARSEGMTYDKIAETFNVSRSYAHAIVKGRKTRPDAYLYRKKESP